MTKSRTLLQLGLAVSLSAVPVSAVWAQGERSAVYFTGPDNALSRVSSFSAGGFDVVVDEPGTNFRGLFARADLGGVVTLIVANKTQSGDVRAYECAAGVASCQDLGVITPLSHATAVSLDIEGNVYAVNADPGGADHFVYVPRLPACAGVSSATCHPAGYGPAQVIDGQVDGASLLADVRAVRGAEGVGFGAGSAYAGGDVLILVTAPSARIIRYRAGTTGYATVATDFGGAEPTGFAVYPPTGDLLVTTKQGRILVIEPSGALQPVDFADLGGQGVQISVGYDDDATQDPYRVFATYNNGGRVVSFVATENGGHLEAFPASPTGTVVSNNPFGVGNASLSDAVFTPASNDAVTVSLPIGHTITFSSTNTGGLTSGAQPLIVEESGVRTSGNQLTIDGVTRTVPAHVRGFPLDGSSCDASGNGCFYLVHVPGTEAGVFGGTQQHFFDDTRFGFDTNCYVLEGRGKRAQLVPDPRQPRVFYATDADDPAIVEAEGYTDITTGCGSRIGRGGQFSFFLAGWDTRSASEIAASKLENLRTALTDTDYSLGGLADYIDPSLQGTLVSLVDQAVKYSRKNKKRGLAALESIVSTVESNPGAFTEEPAGLPARNVPGEIVARAESAYFFVCGAGDACQRPLD